MEAAGIALAAGDRDDAERAYRGAIQAVEGSSDFNTELSTTLCRLGSLKQEAGSYAEAEELFRKGLDVGERVHGSQDVGLVPALTGIGAARIMRGSPELAHPFLARALDLSERHLGEGHPDLVILLNDLTRLYLKQSAYEYAEPLLLRLLALKRTKGEDHPEVATVLASLASLRQATGRYDSAEQLWRRVLEIRERTLAPNHFSLATTLEHLATTLAARGKSKEALQLYQRALSMRELTLGTDHASLRASRERIADLQLQASEDSFDIGPAPAPPSPLRLPSGERFGISPAASATLIAEKPAPAPPPRDVASATIPSTPPNLFDHEAVFEPVRERVETPRPRQAETAQASSEDPAYLKALLEIKDELDQTDALVRTAEHRGISKRAGTMFMATTAFFKHRRAAAVFVGVTVVTLPLVAMAMAGVARSSPVSERQPGFAAEPAAPLTDSMALASLQSGGSRPMFDVSRDSANGSTKAHASRTKGTDDTERRASQSESSDANWIPTLPRPTVSRLDSVVGAMAPPKAIGEVFPIQFSPGNENGVRPTGSDAENANAPQRARLIGSLPTPKYPAQLLLSKIGGEVVVRFQIDTVGRPVMNTFSVVSTPDAGFTAAVRRVIPLMRFEPARSPGPEFKAITDVTEVSFRFSPDMRE
jgi:TonB family protein